MYLLAFVANMALAALPTVPAAPHQPLAHFHIVVSPTRTGYAMTCDVGCRWRALTFDCTQDCHAVIDDQGVYNGAQATPATDAVFAFQFQRKRHGWALTSLRGTAWKSLASGCSLVSCSAGVDEFGVGGPGLQSGQ